MTHESAGRSEPGLLVDREGGILTIRFNRPRSRNAFGWPERRAMVAALEAARDDTTLRLIVIRGDRTAFSAGADLSEMSKGAADTADKLANGQRTIELIADMQVPVVAAVQGHAAGAAVGIAMACDLIYAADNAVFTPSFAAIGLTTDLSVSYWLPRAVGLHRAKEILIGSAPFTAEEAMRLGIVSSVWPLEEFEDKLEERVGTLASGATQAFGSLKRLINRSFTRELGEQIGDEIADQLILVDTEDHAEGLAAFAERRPPRFTGR